MAKRLTSPVVGDFVYRPFEILKPGVVKKVYTKQTTFGAEIYCEIKWLDGTTDNYPAYKLQDFNYATDEHLKKYNKFDNLRGKLKTI